jgi:transaldolase
MTATRDLRAGSDRLRRLREAGVSVWLDFLSRDLLETGELERVLRDFHVTGATSNPTTFAAAITGSDGYAAQVRSAFADGVTDPADVFLVLALDDVQRAADLLRPEYVRSAGSDGFVSFQCTPDVADDADATIAQATALWRRLRRDNVMIKVPATDAGIRAFGELTSRGVNVNVTLLFSVTRYQQVIEAYMSALEQRASRSEPLSGITSVASFFVSRVDARADRQLPLHSRLRGRVALANAASAYDVWQQRFDDPRWGRLSRLGARTQRPLWASTAVKDPAYADLLYVEGLVAPGVISTMPMATLEAFADHGTAASTLPDRGAAAVLEAAASEGLDLAGVTTALERDGVKAFCASYRRVLDCIAEQMPRP